MVMNKTGKKQEIVYWKFNIGVNESRLNISIRILD